MNHHLACRPGARNVRVFDSVAARTAGPCPAASTTHAVRYIWARDLPASLAFGVSGTTRLSDDEI